MKKLLITRPRHDTTVEYLSYWSKEIIKSAKDNNMRVLDCLDKQANKEKVTNYLKKQKPELVIFNGHGNEKTVGGYNNEELIKSGENEELLKSKIVYSIACSTAAKLGKKAYDKGTKAFIGYEQEFAFVVDSTRESNPSKDKNSRPFKKASNAVALSLIKGNTAEEAFEKSQKTYSELIREYSTSTTNKEHKEIRFWLFWNKRFQKLIGKKKVTI